MPRCAAVHARGPERHLHLIIALRHVGGPKDNQEIGSLVKRLSRLEQNPLQEDTDRKRFRLVEQPAPAQP